MATTSELAGIVSIFERLALIAGQAIMEVFDAGAVAVELKSDRSPVTTADRRSEDIILSGLRASLPGLACVAEEEVSAGATPEHPSGPWLLIDPLDGTREFLERRGEFTVNIALIEDGEPRVGVVYAPCTGQFYAGRPGLAEVLSVSSGRDRVEARRPIRVRPCASPPRILASRSHATPETDAFIRRFPAADLSSIGSSLKFCLLADGSADLYPRFGRTMEWDTAAGDAVLRAAGGMTFTLAGEPLRYGKGGAQGGCRFENPSFLATGANLPIAALG